MNINSQPTELNISVSSANEAIEYWLSQVMFKEEVKIKTVNYKPNDHNFVITLDRSQEETPA